MHCHSLLFCIDTYVYTHKFAGFPTIEKKLPALSCPGRRAGGGRGDFLASWEFNSIEKEHAETHGKICSLYEVSVFLHAQSLAPVAAVRSWMRQPQVCQTASSLCPSQRHLLALTPRVSAQLWKFPFAP